MSLEIQTFEPRLRRYQYDVDSIIHRLVLTGERIGTELLGRETLCIGNGTRNSHGNLCTADVTGCGESDCCNRAAACGEREAGRTLISGHTAQETSCHIVML